MRRLDLLGVQANLSLAGYRERTFDLEWQIESLANRAFLDEPLTVDLHFDISDRGLVIGQHVGVQQSGKRGLRNGDFGRIDLHAEGPAIIKGHRNVRPGPLELPAKCPDLESDIARHQKIDVPHLDFHRARVLRYLRLCPMLILCRPTSDRAVKKNGDCKNESQFPIPPCTAHTS